MLACKVSKVLNLFGKDYFRCVEGYVFGFYAPCLGAD